MKTSTAIGTLLILAALILTAQTTVPVLEPAFKGSGSVTGRAAVSSGPIEVYDVTYTPRTLLGKSNSMDRDGNFAVAVNPELILDHKIVAVDRSGRTSTEVTVVAPPAAPAGPG